MKVSNEYKIAFRGLSDGSHDYHWNISKSFFDNFPDSEIRDAAVDVDLLLYKSGRVFELDFTVKGALTVPCDRCLEDLTLHTDVTHKLLIRESSRGEESNDDIVFVSPSDYEIDLAQSIRDFIILSLPMRKVHEDDLCNREMMNRIQDIQFTET